MKNTSRGFRNLSRRKSLLALAAGAVLSIGGFAASANAQPVADLAPFTQLSSCTSTTAYKVIWRGYSEDFDSYTCFSGSGTTTPSSTLTNSLQIVRGVCPGNNIGRIQYKMANGITYNSTLRGPYANNTSSAYCHMFSEEYPVKLIHVYIQ